MECSSITRIPLHALDAMRDNQVRNITDGLKLLEKYVEGRTIARLTDLNQVSEDFFKEFLNELKGLRLRNLNKDQNNHPAIDLGDTSNRICFQVTSDKSAAKIQYTIDKFVEYNLQADYDELYILTLQKKQSQYSTIDSKGTNFDPAQHVIDINSIIAEISCGVPITKLKHLEQLVFNENLTSPATGVQNGQASGPMAKNWARDPRFRSLAIACIIGSWRDDYGGDREIIELFLDDGYQSWLREMRSILQEIDSPVSIKNGHWRVIDRNKLWADLVTCIFDGDLEHLELAAVEVLSETDPKLSLSVEDRLFVFDDKFKKRYSDTIRKGFADTLAFLGRKGDLLSSCSQNHPQTKALLATRQILSSDDHKLWGSLDRLLPQLAEASPEEFLRAIERCLMNSSTLFVELFDQERGGSFSRSYTCGLLWALEGLAWEEQNLTRVAVVLAGLASIDPGGQYSNRPENSLIEIFLPWLSQTLAPFEKQLIAIKTLQTEFYPVLCKLLLSLFPKAHSMSSGTHVPTYLELSEDQKRPRIARAEYVKRISDLAAFAFELAKNDREFLIKFANQIDHLPEIFQEQLATFLRSDAGQKLFDGESKGIWESLDSIVRRHRKYSDADWALPTERVDSLAALVSDIEPKDITQLCERLFNRDEHDLYENVGDWKEQREKLQTRRNEAISAILSESGLDGVIDFSSQVQAPYRVGFSLGNVSDDRIDQGILPKLLTDPNCREFIDGYIWSRHLSSEWQWVDELDKQAWSQKELLHFCLALPFVEETWTRVGAWLNDGGENYWKSVEFNSYQAEGNILIAVDRLLEVGRPTRALDCLQSLKFHKQQIDFELTIKALIQAVSSNEPNPRFDQYHIVELIRELQDAPEPQEGDLVKVEWAYLRLLDQFSNGRPKTLYRKLATEGSFFCEILQMIYKPEGDSEKDSKEIDESTKKIAENAWHLLADWNRAPGVDDSGGFDESIFIKWIEEVLETCKSTGYWGIGLDQIGKALYHCPPEPDGSLWIPKVVAKQLNDSEHEDMRKGYTCEAFNSRGCYTPSVKASMDLVQYWTDKGEAVEAARFHRFATELRLFADQYKREADRLKQSDPFEDLD